MALGTPAKFKLSTESDIRRQTPGRRTPTGRAGLPNLPVGLERSQSSPSLVSLAPGGWLHEERERLSSQGGRNRENPSKSPGSRSGSRSLSSTSAYDSAKHGWYHPRGASEVERLRDPSQQGSWAWQLRKAGDHMGYGEDCMVATGDTQGTAISGDGPSWFIGPKTLEGPGHTKSVAVRRCPKNFIDPDTMKMTQCARTFRQGPNLSVIELQHAASRPPSGEPRFQGNRDPVDRRPLYMQKANRVGEAPAASRSNFESAGGILTKEDSMVVVLLASSGPKMR